MYKIYNILWGVVECGIVFSSNCWKDLWIIECYFWFVKICFWNFLWEVYFGIVVWVKLLELFVVRYSLGFINFFEWDV